VLHIRQPSKNWSQCITSTALFRKLCILPTELCLTLSPLLAFATLISIQTDKVLHIRQPIKKRSQCITSTALFCKLSILPTELSFVLHSPLCKLSLHSQKYPKNLLSSSENSARYKTILVRQYWQTLTIPKWSVSFVNAAPYQRNVLKNSKINISMLTFT